MIHKFVISCIMYFSIFTGCYCYFSKLSCFNWRLHVLWDSLAWISNVHLQDKASSWLWYQLCKLSNYTHFYLKTTVKIHFFTVKGVIFSIVWQFFNITLVILEVTMACHLSFYAIFFQQLLIGRVYYWNLCRFYSHF